MQEVLLIWHEVIGEQVSQSRFSISGLEEGCWNMGWIAIAWELLHCVCEALALARSHLYHPQIFQVFKNLDEGFQFN